MSGELGVATAHLRALSERQRAAAGEMAAATAVAAGVDASVRSTHGAVATATANAVAAIQATRRHAGTRMAEVSHGLAERLDVAAARYDNVDSAAAGGLDMRMRRHE